MSCARRQVLLKYALIAAGYITKTIPCIIQLVTLLDQYVLLA